VSESAAPLATGTGAVAGGDGGRDDRGRYEWMFCSAIAVSVCRRCSLFACRGWAPGCLCCCGRWLAGGRDRRGGSGYGGRDGGRDDSGRQGLLFNVNAAMRHDAAGGARSGFAGVLLVSCGLCCSVRMCIGSPIGDRDRRGGSGSGYGRDGGRDNSGR
jgi:hypothetical protein